MRKPAPECSLVAQRHVFYWFNEAILDFRDELRKPLYFTLKLGPLWVEKNVLPPFHFEKTTNVSAKIVPLAGSRHLRKPRRASKGL